MPPLRHARARARYRGVLRCVALLCLAAQLSVQLHLLVVEHSACPEHGEMVHSSELASAAAEPREVASPWSRLPTLEIGRWGAPSPDDHCGVAQLRRECLHAEIFSAPAAPDAVDLQRPQLSAVVATLSGRARYVLAPKTSPPRA